MIRPDVIRKRLQRLDEHLEFLEGMRRYSEEEYLSNPERYGSAERFLHLAIEAVNDIASHIIAEKELGAVDRYRDLVHIFADQGWIDDEQQTVWQQMIGCRNVLVHVYLDVDRKLVYTIIQEHLDDIRGLKKVMAQFL